MQFEEIEVTSLIEYDDNARVHSEAQIGQLASSIKKCGFCAPCLVDDEGVVIAGHGRLLAAKKSGLDKVPVVRISHLTPTQIRAYRIADNQLALNSAWDLDFLSMEFKALKDDGFDLELLGFDGDLVGRTATSFLDDLSEEDGGSESFEKSTEASMGHSDEYVTLEFSFKRSDRDLVVEKLRTFASRQKLNTMNSALLELAKGIRDG